MGCGNTGLLKAKVERTEERPSGVTVSTVFSFSMFSFILKNLLNEPNLQSDVCVSASGDLHLQSSEAESFVSVPVQVCLGLLSYGLQ